MDVSASMSDYMHISLPVADESHAKSPAFKKICLCGIAELKTAVLLSEFYEHYLCFFFGRLGPDSLDGVRQDSTLLFEYCQRTLRIAHIVQCSTVYNALDHAHMDSQSYGSI